MKKNTLVSLLLFTALNFVSCGSEDKKTGEHGAVYYCPMECEGDKTYQEQGQCAVCGMDLVEKE